MNFLKKYSVYLAILLYIIVGVGWVSYIYHSDSQANFSWSLGGLILDFILVVIWPMYPFNLIITGMQDRENRLVLTGAIGLILVLIIFFGFSMLVRKANQKKSILDEK